MKFGLRLTKVSPLLHHVRSRFFARAVSVAASFPQADSKPRFACNKLVLSLRLLLQSNLDYPNLDQYPDLLLWSQFFVNINCSYFMMSSKTFFPQIVWCNYNSGANWIGCASNRKSVHVSCSHNQCISLSLDWPRFSPFLSKISRKLSQSARLRTQISFWVKTN